MAIENKHYHMIPFIANPQNGQIYRQRLLMGLGIRMGIDPLLGIHTKETRTERDMGTPMFIAALFTIDRTWKQPRCPSTDEWISCGAHTQWNIIQPLKRIHLNRF